MAKWVFQLGRGDLGSNRIRQVTHSSAPRIGPSGRMGCGASVPKGEIDQELKQQKTKNDESQRQLDHMKELYARERERNKELRGQMKQKSEPGTPQSEPQEPNPAADPPAQPDPPAPATTEPEAIAEDAAAEPTPTEDTETPEAAGGEPAPEQETEADANATEPDAEMSPSEAAPATDAESAEPAESTEPETTAADEPTAAEPTDATTEAAPENTEAGSAAEAESAPNADAEVVLNLNFIADAAEKAKLEAEKAEADAEVKRLEAALAEAASEAAAKVAALEAAVAEANAKTEAAEKAKTDAEEAKAAAETADETAKAGAADEVAKTQTALANILNAQEQAGARVAALETAVAEANAKTAEAQAAAQAQAAEAMRMMAQMAEMAARQQASAAPAAAAVPVAAPAAVPVAAAATFGPYGPEHEASAVRIQTSARGKLARSASKRIREEVRGCPYGDMAVSEVWVPESTTPSCIDPSNADVIAKHEPVWSRLRTNLHPHATKDAKSPLKPHGSKSLKLWSDAYTLAKCGAFELAIEAYWRFTHERMSELGHTRYGTIPPFFAHDHQDYLNSLYNVASLLEAQAVDPGPDPSAEEILHPEKVLKGDKHAQAYGLFSELVRLFLYFLRMGNWNDVVSFF